MIPSLLPNPLFDYMKLFNLLLPVAALFVGIGLLSAFQRATSIDQLRALVQVVAIVAFLANFDLAVQTTKRFVQRLVAEELKANPEQFPKKFIDKLMAGEAKDEETGFFSQLTNAGTHLVDGLLAAVIVFVGIFAMVLFFLGYLAQELALEMGIGLAPLFVGFLLLQSTRSIAVQFLLFMLAIALFPLGWGAASLVSDQLIDFATKNDLGLAKSAVPSLSLAMRHTFGTLLLAIWLILSTIIAPFAMVRAVTTGVHLSTDGLRALQNYFRS